MSPPGLNNVILSPERSRGTKNPSELFLCSAPSPFSVPSAISFLFLWLALIAFSIPAAAQSLSQDLTTFVQTPAVTGYEHSLASEIRARLKTFDPRTDNLGNVIVTLGSGSPSRLIVTPMDEPGYIVSAVTPDGYLRVQRLPQQAPHPLFDLLHAAQPVTVSTRSGKSVYGVIAGLSTHLQPNRQNAPRAAHPDEIFVDIGTSSPAEVQQAGVDILDPISLDRSLLALGFGHLTSPAIGDRFGCAALVELLRRLDPSKLTGTLTVGFVAQQWASSRGLDRLMQQVKPDEMIYVGRLLPRRGPGAQAAPLAPSAQPGSGVLIGALDPHAPVSGFAETFKRLADENKIPVAADFSAPLPRVSYTQGPVLPQRFVHLGVPTRFPLTPAELLDQSDLWTLVSLLELYAQGSRRQGVPPGSASGTMNGLPAHQNLPIAVVLQKLVETYGVSGNEGPVREAIKFLLPYWAKPETDAAGNLVLRFSATPPNAQTLAQVERIAFVAHMDEIGYVVRSISADGKLEVQSRGGGISEFFLGHAVLVHSKSGPRPGVLELPQGWDAPDFQWPRGPQAQAQPAEARTIRVDVGARSPDEVAQLGIAIGDTLTVPKKYRKLFGTRANGRSFDDRVGCAALISAIWALGSNPPAKEILFIWSTEEEVGLRGARAIADRLAAEGRSPDYVFAVDTFVSSDSPLESDRFADAPIGKGFVIRAADNSNIVARKHVDRLVMLARTNSIPVQYGVTGGGNDGAVFLRHGTVDIPIAWPLRYSHSPGEVIDTRDLDALARIIAVLVRSW